MFKGFMFFFKQGLKYDKRYILWLILLQLVTAVTPIAAALLPKLVIDELAGARRIGYLSACVGAFAGWMLLNETLTSFFMRDGFTRRCRVNAAFDTELHARLARADYADLESSAFKDRQAKAEKFLTCDYHGFGYLLDCGVNVMGQLTTIAGLLVMLSALELWLVATFAALAVIGSVLESKAMRKAMRLSMEVVKQSRLWMYYSELFEQSDYGKEIRLNGMANWLLGREREAMSMANANIKRQNDCYIVSGAQRAVITFVQQCAAYGALIWKVLAGSLGIGSFAMCVSATGSLAFAVRKLMDSLTEIRAYDLYYEQLDEYLSTPQTLRAGRRHIAAGRHRIEFCDVGYRYAGAENWALRHINLALEPGQRLALVGENGSGKSTLIKLLCRLYAPSEGVIRLDGVDIAEYDYDEYVELFAAVFQDYRLFECSVRDNILLGRDVDASELDAIVAQVGLAQRIASLPHGLDTAVGRRFDKDGFEPSGGEAQKIVLARALCRDAQVIVLDEPTAAMDPRAEYELYRDFDALVGDKTAVYISHRLAACRFCDCIAVLDGGRLSEYGTHTDLMAGNNKYAELYALQAQYYV